MSVWQPIESAPKDGTRILVLWPGNYVGIAWWKTNPRLIREPHAVVRNGWQASYFACSEELDDYEISMSENQPTHWMPLPSPPKEKGV